MVSKKEKKQCEDSLLSMRLSKNLLESFKFVCKTQNQAYSRVLRKLMGEYIENAKKQL